ncbi:endonuclease NucS domain-containing protein [Phaeodactylibacter xiamenensis]|uniref:endonuclease NucS domain-containing protein n=1 Tax=Phaeodactylibacter xiamenensis TaxID=1524460 RepID=UPI003BA9A3C1
MESKIRDNLAERLNIIDQSLVLIEKEFFIDPKLEVKTKGFIDILAKDNKNRVVVIEIKRSNQAARQAIHELLKYKVFVQQKFGLKDSEVRLILASSEWNELIYPFSEFASRFQIEGYQLIVNNEWSVKSAQRISILNIPRRHGEFSPNHSVDLFITREKRNDFTEMISCKLIKLGIDDFVILDGSAP